MIRNLLLLLPLAICAMESCKSTNGSPPWEVIDLTDSLRAKAGGNFVALKNGITHYELSGPDTGRPVVLVHGSLLPLWTWDKQVEMLDSAGFRVLRYDEFGRGFSDRPHVDYSVDMYCDQLIQLLDTLGVRKPVSLVGISFGCVIIAVYAARFPDRIDRMVFIAPVVNPLSDFAKVIAKSSIGASFVKGQLKKQVTGDIQGTLLARGMSNRYADMFVEQASIKGFQASVISFFRNGAVTDLRPYYQKTGKSVHNVMLIWGDHDKTVRKSNVTAFTKEIPQARVEIIKNAGHLAPFEATDRVNELLGDFLRK